MQLQIKISNDFVACIFTNEEGKMIITLKITRESATDALHIEDSELSPTLESLKNYFASYIANMNHS